MLTWLRQQYREFKEDQPFQAGLFEAGGILFALAAVVLTLGLLAQ